MTHLPPSPSPLPPWPAPPIPPRRRGVPVWLIILISFAPIVCIVVGLSMIGMAVWLSESGSSRKIEVRAPAPPPSQVAIPGSVIDKVCRVVAEQLGVSPQKVQLNTHLKRDLKVDELGMAEIVMELEGQFDISVPDDQVDRVQTVSDLVVLVARSPPRDAMTPPRPRR